MATTPKANIPPRLAQQPRSLLRTQHILLLLATNAPLPTTTTISSSTSTGLPAVPPPSVAEDERSGVLPASGEPTTRLGPRRRLYARARTRISMGLWDGMC